MARNGLGRVHSFGPFAGMLNFLAFRHQFRQSHGDCTSFILFSVGAYHGLE